MGLKILHWNAQSLPAHGQELKHYISTVSFVLHIICIQETWLHAGIDFIIPGYSVLRHDRPDGIRGGGCAFFVHSSISYRDLGITSAFECGAIEVFFPDHSISLVNLYSCSSFSLRDFRHILSQLPSTAMLCGDFNAHNPLWGSAHLDAKGKVIDSLLEDTDLVLLNDGSGTRINRSGELSPLDLTLVSFELAAKCTWQVLGDSLGSDHLPVLVSFFDSPIHIDNSSGPRWNFKKADWKLFSALCSSSIAESIVCDDVTKFSCSITDCIVAAANASIPTVTYKRRSGVPWWNGDCSAAKKARQRAYNTVRRTGQLADFEDYKRHCAIVKRTTKRAKRTYWREYCSTVTKDNSIPKVWRTVKKMNNVGQSFSYPSVKATNGQALSDPQHKADAFAEHFAGVSSDANYTSEFRTHKAGFESAHAAIFTSSSSSPDVYNEPFTMAELMSALRGTSESSPGADRIHYTLLKNLPDTSLVVLLELYNLVWQNQCIPSSWKHSIVIPIRKPGKDPSSVSSYRPIALTSCLCKLLERMVNSRLMWFLEKNCLLSETQSGFRKSRSTAEPLVRLETAIRQTFLLSEYLVAVFLDFEKAYDMLWTQGLLYKLDGLGIRGNMFGFLRSFLLNRTFQVRLHQTVSRVCTVSNGTPQGSVISPTLFNVMVNDLHTVLSRCALSQFADDSSIWSCFRDIMAAKNAIEADLEHILQWCHSWGFKLSGTKTVAMIFTRRRIPPGFQISMGRIPLTIVTHAKLLGLTFDTRLTWAVHIAALVTRCKKILQLLKSLSGTDWGGRPRQMLQLYRSLVRSRLDYGCQVYASASPSVLNQLNTIQATGLRICLGVPRTTSTEALQVEAGELPLDLRREQLTAQFYIRSFALPEDHPLTAESSISWLFFARQAFCTTLKNPPFIVRAHTTFDSLPFGTLNVESTSPVSFPPWHLDPPEVGLDLQSSCPKNNPPVKSKAIADEYIARNCGHSLAIYTDGSKTPTGDTGAAFVVPELRISKGFRLPDHVSVFTCELTAILMALFWVEDFRPNRATIFTDSLSSLQAMINVGRHSKKLIFEILRMCTLLYNSGTAINFIWIPSHVGISGNEMADRAAKEALQGINTVMLPYSVSEVGGLVKRHIMLKWQSRWDLSSHGRFFHGIKPKVSREMSTFGNTRRDNTIYVRLRLGQCNLKSRLHLIGKHPTGLCGCGVPDTVDHYLFGCFRYIVQRAQFFRDLEALQLLPTLPVLGHIRAVPAILAYVKATGRYSDL